MDLSSVGSFEEGLHQLRDAVSRAEDEFQRIQKRAEKQRTRFEKRFRRRVGAWRREVAQRWERGVERALEELPVASKRDLARIDRKLTAIRKQLRELERERQTPRL